MEAKLVVALDSENSDEEDWARKGALNLNPLAMVRASVVDMTSEEPPALKTVSMTPMKVGVECDGFVERLLPGMVEKDSDGTPVTTKTKSPGKRRRKRGVEDLECLFGGSRPCHRDPCELSMPNFNSLRRQEPHLRRLRL